MAKKQPPTFEELGAQYRDARDSVAVHRRRQAQAELDLHQVRRTGDVTAVKAAQAKVRAATADVRWCQAVVVAAGEAFKGVTFAAQEGH